ncbi:60S ribosomal protein L18 [Trichonephila clavata]|uniref:Large ribosomal subunit protein eL18 n=1 Tax=Trichonephila clavata TaxID=2740835 RepID=A0A8X6GGS1_TRICU|nr:60S ribosomal protein L18 [Trichonephila clavata]
MGIDICHKYDRKVVRRAPKSQDIYLRLIVKLYRFLARRSGCKFNKIVLKRLFMSRINRAPVSLTKLVKYMKKPGNENKVAVTVGTITDDIRLIGDVPKMTLCALRVTERARARILKAGGEIITFDQLAVRHPRGKNTLLIQEEGVRNAFRWNWIERRDGNGDTIGTWCKKINVAGQAYCAFCNSLLKYGGEGFKAFTNHSKTVTHIKYSKCIRHSMTLSNYANSKNTDDLLETDAWPLDIVTRKARQEVLITFIAENSLSFNVAPNLIELCKQLSRDQAALNSLEMSRTTACYKMKYGLAKTIKENIIKTLKKTPFSLNLDESTSNAQESLLAILVQFYDNNQNEVVVHHFASLKMESCNLEAVFKAVNTIEDNIPWANLIGVLMDSCNTMRGKKGVETRLGSNKAPHLLDIDGDTCHTANNCKKKICFLDKTDKGDYFSYVETIYNKRNISAAQKKIVEGVYSCLHSEQLTKDALARKKRILNGLFVMQNKTLLHMALYSAVLPEFNTYIKLF